MPDKWLSKSKYLNGLQCPKLLWIAVNEPEGMPEPDAATQQIFDQGHKVGIFAKKLFPRADERFRPICLMVRQTVAR